MIIHNLEPRPIKRRRQMLSSNSQTHRIRDTLSQRTSSELYALVLDLRMTRTQAIGAVGVVGEKLFPGHRLVPREIEISVLEETCVAWTLSANHPCIV
jgi:hypothetical protein